MKRVLLGLALLSALVTAVPSQADAAVGPRRGVRAASVSAVAGPKWRFAGTDCNLISTKVATPFGLPTTCPGVRPGAYVQSAIGGCTFNFLYTALGTNETYAGTAGHCIVPQSAEGEYTSFPDPRAFARIGGSAVHIGNFVYGRLDNRYDFALIRLNAAGEAAGNAQMCHFGGPTGMRTGNVGLGEHLQHYGNGLLIGSTVPARTHLAVFSDAYSVTTASFAAIGDSGSGMTDAQGRATGVVVSVASVAYGSAVVFSSRLDTHLARAGTVLGRNFAVMTAPLL